jgi:hypothetical protein
MGPFFQDEPMKARLSSAASGRKYPGNGGGRALSAFSYQQLLSLQPAKKSRIENL